MRGVQRFIAPPNADLFRRPRDNLRFTDAVTCPICGASIRTVKMDVRSLAAGKVLEISQHRETAAAVIDEGLKPAIQ